MISIFELESPGGGDLVVLFFIVTLLLYCLSSCADLPGARWLVIVKTQQWLKRRREFQSFLIRYRLQLEFLVVSAFTTSTLMVKTLKWVMARPRPKKILRGTRDFYEWFEFGPYFLDEGLYRASFPSGHTASAISLIGLAYVLVYSSTDRRWKVAGLFVFGGVVLFALLMATARVMTTAHWPSDVIFSLFGGWLLIHLLFFGYYYPLQLREVRAVPETIETAAPRFRGFMLCWQLSLLCLSAVGVIIGLRHFLNDRWPWLIIISLAGGALGVYSLRAIIRLRNESGP